jgi:hypothetical protein
MAMKSSWISAMSQWNGFPAFGYCNVHIHFILTRPTTQEEFTAVQTAWVDLPCSNVTQQIQFSF